MRITIWGDCPSKKNSRILSLRKNRVMSFPGQYYRHWAQDAAKQLLTVRNFANPRLITLTFHPKSKRKGDLTNKAESILDALVDNGVLLDDNWFLVPKLLLNFGGVDTKNPRVEIEIE